MIDIFYETIKRDIISFYDNYYIGSVPEKEYQKNLHLIVLEEEYDLKQFENGNLRENKIIFLTGVQNLVNDIVLG